MSKGGRPAQCRQPHSPAWIQPDRRTGLTLPGEQMDAHRKLLPPPRTPPSHPSEMFGNVEAWCSRNAQGAERVHSFRDDAARAAGCTDALVMHTHFMHGVFIYSLAAAQLWHFPLDSMSQGISQLWLRPLSCVITGEDQVKSLKTNFLAATYLLVTWQ